MQNVFVIRKGGKKNMKKRMQKLFTVMLIVSLMMSMMSVGAFAAEADMACGL